MHISEKGYARFFICFQGNNMATHQGSVNHVLSGLQVGTRMYVETTYADAANTMRLLNPPKSRRPAPLRDWVFRTELLTAVCAGNASDVRHLVCVTRTA